MHLNVRIRFMSKGIPSKSKIAESASTGFQSNYHGGSVSPLIMSIPLDFELEEDWEPYEYYSLPATLPTCVTLSSDSTLGVAYVESSNDDLVSRAKSQWDP